MKKLQILLVFSLISFSGLAQTKDWAVGFRIGEPGGLMLRRYLNNDKNVLEFNVGTYGALWGNISKYRDGQYKNIGFAFNGQYLWRNEMGKSGKLMNYYGFGGQITSRTYYSPKNINGQIIDIDQSNIALGGVGTAGLEYFPDGAPLSIFMEVGLYAELIPAVLYLHPQGGVGVRLNF